MNNKTEHFNEIHDMPIEHDLERILKFECYSFGDQIRCYSDISDGGESKHEILIISEEMEIFKEVKLRDLITSEGIKYFQIKEYSGVVNSKQTIDYTYICPENRNIT